MFLVAHSYTLDLEDVMLPALPKITDQIRVREKKDRELEETVKVSILSVLKALQSLREFTMDQLYSQFHAHKGGKQLQVFDEYMKMILYRRLQLLIE